MNYLWASMVAIAFWLSMNLISSIFGFLSPLLFGYLGMYLSTKSVYIGIGGILGSLLNYFGSKTYIKESGVMTSTPVISVLSSISFILSYIISILLLEYFDFDFSISNMWPVLLGVSLVMLLVGYYTAKKHRSEVKSFVNNVVKYKIVKKYFDEPGWATYLYFKNGSKGWNETIPGSFRAKDPKSDLTFVFNTKQEAVDYASQNFINAEEIKEEDS